MHRRTIRTYALAATVVAATGLVGCLVLAASLPLSSVVSGAGVLAVGALTHLVRSRRRRTT